MSASGREVDLNETWPDPPAEQERREHRDLTGKEIYTRHITMKLSIVTFCASLLLFQSQEVRSQSNSLRRGGEDKSNGFEDVVTSPSNHRLLETNYWVQVASFDQLEDSNYGGYRVSISGDGSFIAAAPLSYSETGKTRNGIVRFFKKDDGAWKENIDLRLLGTADEDRFGSDFSLSGNGQRVAIGARQGAAYNTGSGSIYEMRDGTWGEPLQVIDGESEYDNFGTSVALSKDGKTLAIGAAFNDSNGDQSGRVRVYQLDSDTSSFVKMGEDIDGETVRERSGRSVALSENGSVLAIGGPGPNSFAGKVRVFYWEPDDNNAKGGSWKQLGLTLYGNAEDDSFGYSVDLSDDGKILAVGARFGNYAKVFQWKDSNDDGDDWQPMGDSLTVDGASRLVSVSLSSSPSSTILAVGFRYTAYTYKLVDNESQQSWELLAGEVPGAEVALSSDGQTLAVGSPYGDDTVTVYNLVDITSAPIISSAPTISSAPSTAPTILSSPSSNPTITTSAPTSNPTSGPTLAANITSAPTSGPSPSGSNGDPHCMCLSPELTLIC
eukprot:scaffold3240_cov68-Cylindrotheca_fusiformis.AAC.4